MSAAPPTTRPLPPGWRWARLGDICRFASGGFIAATSVQTSGKFPVYGANGILGYTSAANSTGFKIIIGRVGSVGVINDVNEDAWITDNTIVCEPHGGTDGDYVRSYLESIDLPSYRSASVQPLITQSSLRPLPIPLPPLPEQRRIAAILRDQLDAVRRAREAALARLQAARALPAAFLRSVFESEEAKEWPRVRLVDACDIVSGGTPSKAHPEFWGGSIPWIAPQHLKSFEVGDSDQRITEAAVATGGAQVLPPGAVLVVVRGMILIRDVPVALTTKRVAINQDLKALVPRSASLSGEYLARYLTCSRDRLLALVSTAGHGTQKLDTPALTDIEVPQPALEVQETVVLQLGRCTAQADKIYQVAGAELTALEALPQCLLRQSFAGQL